MRADLTGPAAQLFSLNSNPPWNTLRFYCVKALGSVVYQVFWQLIYDSDFRKSEAEDGSEWADVDDEKEEGSDDNDCDSAGSFSDEDVPTPGKIPGALENHLFWEEETKSRFTEYSMTSSVMRRNEQLTLHDERFEKVRSQLRAF